MLIQVEYGSAPLDLEDISSNAQFPKRLGKTQLAPLTFQKTSQPATIRRPLSHHDVVDGGGARVRQLRLDGDAGDVVERVMLHAHRRGGGSRTDRANRGAARRYRRRRGRGLLRLDGHRRWRRGRVLARVRVGDLRRRRGLRGRGARRRLLLVEDSFEYGVEGEVALGQHCVDFVKMR